MITDQDDIFVYYTKREDMTLDDSRYAHFGWEGGTNAFAFQSYVEGYYMAAETIYSKMRDAGRDYKIIDTLIYPLCFNIRHCIEMYLKMVFVKFTATEGQSVKGYLNNNHNLVQLWNKLKPILSTKKKRVGSSVNISAIEHFIKAWSKFDNKSDSMRYPTNKSLAPNHTDTKLDYVILWERMADFKQCMDKFLDDIDQQVNLDMDEDKINEYLSYLDAEKDSIRKFMDSLVQIIKQAENAVDTSSVIERLMQPNETSQQMRSLTSNQLILLETLYYVGQNVATGSLRLPKNPSEAKNDVVKCCVQHMDWCKWEFEKDVPEGSSNLWGKQPQIILQSVQSALDVIYPKYQILILGGTGAMGANLVDILNEQDKFHVVVTSRKQHEDYENVEYRLGDAHNNEWLKVILNEQRWDAIVDFMIYTTEEFRQRVSILLVATKQYVFISSARVYADSGDNPITENSPRLLDVCTDTEYLQTDEYALTKARQEDILFNSLTKNWTIIRPYITFSEDRLQLGVMEKEQWLIPALNNRPIVFSNDIAEHYTTMTNGHTVAKCIAALLTRPETRGEVFHLASSEYQKWSDILNWYIEAYEEVKGVKPAVYMIDKWDIILGGGLYQLKYDRLYNRRFDNTKIRKFISEDVFVPTKSSLQNAAKAFITKYQPNLNDLNQSIEFQRGVVTGQFLSLGAIHGKKRKLKVLAYKMHIEKPLIYLYHLWKG